MGDMGELYRAMGEWKKARRACLGVNCPKCREIRPRAHPSILLPGQRCKVDGYRDPRNMTRDQQDAAVMAHLSRRASLTNPRDAHNSTTPASEAGWGTESGA